MYLFFSGGELGIPVGATEEKGLSTAWQAALSGASSMSQGQVLEDAPPQQSDAALPSVAAAAAATAAAAAATPHEACIGVQWDLLNLLTLNTITHLDITFLN